MATEIIRDRIFFWIERNRIENYLWNYFKNNFFCLEISWAFIVDRLWSRRDGINEKFSGKVNRDRFSIEKKKKTEQRRVLGCDKFLLDIFEYLILDVCVCDGDTLLPHTHTHTQFLLFIFYDYFAGAFRSQWNSVWDMNLRVKSIRNKITTKLLIKAGK